MTLSRRLHQLLGAALILLAGGLYLAGRAKEPADSTSARQRKESPPPIVLSSTTENSGGKHITDHEEEGTATYLIRSGSFDFSAAVAATPNGMLTTRTIEKLGLTDDEVRQISISNENLMDRAASDFVQRTKLTDSRSNGLDSSNTFFTPARPDRGQEFWEGFHMEAEGIVGKERSRELLKGMEPFGYAGGMGRYDLETEIVHINGVAGVRQKYLDPENGRVLCTSESSPTSFRERFGDLFDVTANKLNKLPGKQ